MQRITVSRRVLTATLLTLLLVLAAVFHFAGYFPAYATEGSTPTAVPPTPALKHPLEEPSEAVTTDSILTLGLIVVVIVVAGTLWPRPPTPQK